MSPEPVLRLVKTNAALSGVVSGIMASMGLAFLLLGLIGIALHESSIGLLALVMGGAFIALASDIATSHINRP